MTKYHLAFERYKEIKQYLRKLYPNAFLTYKPLKIGIRDELLKEHNEGKLGDIELEELKIAISRYCASKKYKEARQVGAIRYDLQGNEAGIVEEFVPPVTTISQRSNSQLSRNDQANSSYRQTSSRGKVVNKLPDKISNKLVRPTLSLKK